MTFNEIIQSSKPVLVDFFADWCGPCKTMAPILKDLKSDLGEEVTIIKVNVDKNQEAGRQWEVQSIPTLILFKNGKVLWRQTGVQSKGALLSIIRGNLSA